jgi:hypothetical protein
MANVTELLGLTTIVVSFIVSDISIAQPYTMRKTDAYVSDWGDWTGPNADFIGGTRSPDDPIARCPTDTFITGIRVFRTGPGYDPITHFRYLCGSTTNGGIFIGRDDPVVPRNLDNWPDYTGSEREDSAIAQCPLGSFVVGIQGFKGPATRNVQYPVMNSLRYLCESSTGNTVVRRTDAAIPDTGSFNAGGGTQNYDSNVAKCPDGYFVTGIQGFRFDIRKTGNNWGWPAYPIVDLRYICDH